MSEPTSGNTKAKPKKATARVSARSNADKYAKETAGMTKSERNEYIRQRMMGRKPERSEVMNRRYQNP